MAFTPTEVCVGKWIARRAELDLPRANADIRAPSRGGELTDEAVIAVMILVLVELTSLAFVQDPNHLATLVSIATGDLVSCFGLLTLCVAIAMIERSERTLENTSARALCDEGCVQVRFSAIGGRAKGSQTSEDFFRMKRKLASTCSLGIVLTGDELARLAHGLFEADSTRFAAALADRTQIGRQASTDVLEGIGFLIVGDLPTPGENEKHERRQSEERRGTSHDHASWSMRAWVKNAVPLQKASTRTKPG